MDLGSRPRSTHGVDGPSPSTMARVTRNRDDALHLQGQLDTSLRGGDTDGVGELALCFFTTGTARRFEGVSERILWRRSVFPSESDAVLYGSTDCRSRVDGGLLHPITDEMVTGRRAGQVALGHVPIIIVLELSRAVRRVPGGLALGRAGRDTDVTISHDAVHGLRAAPEPDAALRQAVEVSQFVALVQ